MSAYYYYKTVGVINEDRSNMPDSQRSLPREAQLPGYPIIDDRNGDGKIDIDDIYMDNTCLKSIMVLAILLLIRISIWTSICMDSWA